jgi:hypothetical protein
MKKEIVDLNFIDFFENFQLTCEVSKSNNEDDDDAMAKRYTIERVSDKNFVVVCAKPEYPLAMRDPGHKDHEKYCEMRVRTMMPHTNATTYSQFMSDMEARSNKDNKFKAAYIYFRQIVSGLRVPTGSTLAKLEPMTPFEDRRKDWILQRQNVLREAGVLNRDDILDPPLRNLLLPVSGRVQRALIFDSAPVGGELENKNNDRDVPAPASLPGTTETWALTATAAAVRTHVAATTLATDYFDKARLKYSAEELAEMSLDWIKKLASSSDTVIAPFAHSDVELRDLNSEQQYVCSKLIRHYKATEAAKFRDLSFQPP